MEGAKGAALGFSWNMMGSLAGRSVAAEDAPKGNGVDAAAEDAGWKAAQNPNDTGAPKDFEAIMLAPAGASEAAAAVRSSAVAVAVAVFASLLPSVAAPKL